VTAPHEQKLRVTGPVLITANRLGDGAVVYFTAAGQWSTRLERAAVVTTAAEATALLKRATAQDIEAVGAYVAPVARDADGALRPGNLREAIRQGGPTFDLPVTFGI
jgi:Protein of unknown function (DUF2849)